MKLPIPQGVSLRILLFHHVESEGFFRIKITESRYQKQDDYRCGSALAKIPLIKKEFVGIYR